MGIFSKKQKGQRARVKAEDWNAMLEAAQAQRGLRLDRRSAPQEVARQPDLAKVQNLSGAALGRFAAVALRTPIIAEDDNAPEFKRVTNFAAYKAEAADLTEVPTKVGILLVPLASTAIGDCLVAGVAPCQVTMVSATHRYADLTSGQEYLTSATSGSVEILWAESGTGLKWAYVRLGSGNTGAAAGVPDCSGVVAGKVNLSAQTLGAGLKTITDGLIVGSSPRYLKILGTPPDPWFNVISPVAAVMELGLTANSPQAGLFTDGAGAGMWCLRAPSGGPSYSAFGIQESGGTVHKGAQGTLADGSTVYGGIIDSVGSTIDGGTF